MKDLTLAFTIIIKGCIANKMTPEQIASQLNEHVQHEVKNLNIPDVIKSVCPSCESDDCSTIQIPLNRCNYCGTEWQTDC